MRWRGLAALALLAFAPCVAHAADDLAASRLWASAAVASTGCVTSVTLSLDRQDFESLVFQASSASGTADVKIEWAGCRRGPGVALADAVCGSFDDHADLVVSSAALPNPEGWHEALGVTVGFEAMQVKICGTASNPADTILTLDFIGREYSG